VRLLRHDDDALRTAAIQGLGSLGPRARRAGKALHKALGQELKRDDPRVAFPMMTALARVLPADEAVPALVYALRHDDPTVRLGAVQALALVAEASEQARDAIERARGDEHELVRQRAGEELERLGR
jgi:HEAT repeat protein